MPEKSLKRLVALSLGISITTIIIILLLTVNVNTLEGLRKCALPFLILALIAHMVSWCLYSLNQMVILRPLGVHLGFFRSLKILLASRFMAIVTPTYIGGEPLRIYLLYKEKTDVGSAVAVTIIDRVFDAIFFLILFILTAGALTVGNVAPLLLLVSVLLFALFFLIFKKFEWVKKLILRLTFREKWKQKVGKELDNLQSGMTVMLKHKTALFGSFFLKGLSWTAEFTVIVMIALGLGLPVNWTSFFFIQTVMYIIGFVAITPGGSGITEALMTSLLGTVVVNVSLIGVVLVIWRVITFYLDVVVSGAMGMHVIRDFWKGGEVVNSSDSDARR
jgi:hypothetical protein